MTVDPAWMELVLLLVLGFMLFLMESLCFSIYKIRTLVTGNNSTFFLIYMPFTSSCGLITLRLTGKCWIEVVRVSRHPSSFLFLEERLSIFCCWVWHYLVMYGLYYVEVMSFYFQLVDGVYYERRLHCVKQHFDKCSLHL